MLKIMGDLTKPVDIESIMKNGVRCKGCGEVMPADIMEGAATCPECEVESGEFVIEEGLYKGDVEEIDYV